MADDDLALLQAIQGGDERALALLMQRYREPVFRLAYRYLGNAVDARTVAEETFTKVYFNAHRFRPRAAVRSWLFAIAANHCRDFLRRQKRHARLRSLFGHPSKETETDLSENLPAPDRGAAASLEANETLAALQAAIRDLPEKLRFPFVFCVLEDHSQEEAAEVLGVSRKTVELRIYRARKELQQRVERTA